MRLLEHEDQIVRYNAVNSLAFEFHHKPIAERLLAMLTGDPDDDCRGVAPGGLGVIFQNTKDRQVLDAFRKVLGAGT